MYFPLTEQLLEAQQSAKQSKNEAEQLRSKTFFFLTSFSKIGINCKNVNCKSNEWVRPTFKR